MFGFSRSCYAPPCLCVSVVHPVFEPNVIFVSAARNKSPFSRFDQPNSNAVETSCDTSARRKGAGVEDLGLALAIDEGADDQVEGAVAVEVA